MSYDSQIAQREIDVIVDELSKTADVSGDVVEFGCYTGDTSVILAREMQNQPDKWLWLYDSFEGLPEKSTADQSAAGWRFKAGELKASPEQVLHKFKKFQLPDPVIKRAGLMNSMPMRICRIRFLLRCSTATFMSLLKLA